MEPMNTTSQHSKVRVGVELSSSVFVAGDEITGKMEMECRADKGLGISDMIVELIATQELTSRDHSATSMFLSSKRLFQGPGLPPSNAVMAHPIPGAPPLPQQYFQARKGSTTFFFNFPIPFSSPNTINFGNGLAKVRYEVRATAGVFWKGERTYVQDSREIDIAECLVESRMQREPTTVVAEAGKMWVQGQILGGFAIAGRSACVELKVKNHSTKKTAGLTLVLSRTLHLPGIGSSKNIFQVTDTILTIPFRGSEYAIVPGVEGVANLMFAIPRNARGVKGGAREQAEEGERHHTEALFEVKASVLIKIGMGVGSKDVTIEIPLVILHPSAVPEPVQMSPYASPNPVYQPDYTPFSLEPPRPFYAQHTGSHPSTGPPSPALSYTGTPSMPYMGTPPAIYAAMSPFSAPYFAPPPLDQPYYLPPPPNVPLLHLQRPLSAGPLHSQSLAGSLPVPLPPLPPAPRHAQPRAPVALANIEVTAEEGKGERASRISQHLKNHIRNRSASPTSHRYRMAGLPFPANDLHPVMATRNTNKSTMAPLVLPIPEPILHSPRPMLSPKASFSNDPIGSPGSLRTTRVEALEFMAEVVEKMEQESRATRKVSGTSASSAELDAKELNAILDTIEEAASNTKKTLPGPPVPSARTKPVPIGGTRLVSLFDAPVKPPSAVKPNPVREQAMVRDSWVRDNRAKHLEAITTLANIAPAAVMPLGDTSSPDPVGNTRTMQARARPQELSKVAGGFTPLVPKSATSEVVERSAVPIRNHYTNEMLPPARAGVSGLDALEKRLVKEVGTRKPGFAAIAQLRALGAATEPLVAQAIQGKRAARVEASPAAAGLTTAPEPITAFQQSKKLEGLEPRVRSATQSGAATIAPSLDSEAAAEVILNRKRRKSFEQETFQVANLGSKNDSGAIPKDEHEGLRLRRLAKGRVAAWLGEVQAVEPDPPPPSEARIFEKANMEEKLGLGAVPRSTSPKRLAAKLSTSEDIAALAEPSVFMLAAISNQAAPSRRTAEGTKPPGSVPEAQPVLSRIPSYIARPTKVGMDAPKSTAIRPVSPVSPVSPISPLAPPKSPMAPCAPVPKPLSSPLLVEPDALKYGVKSARGGRGGKVTSVAAIWATKDQTNGAPPLVPAFKPIFERNSNDGGAVNGRTVEVSISTTPWLAAAPIPTTKPNVLSSPKISVPPLSQKPVFPQSERVARTPAAVFQPTQPYPLPATASGRPDNRLMKATSVPAMLSSSVAVAGLSSTATLARPIISNPITLPSSTSAPVIAPSLGAKRRSFQPLPPSMEEQRAKSPSAAEISFGQAKLNDLIRKYQGQS